MSQERRARPQETVFKSTLLNYWSGRLRGELMFEKGNTGL